MEQTDTEMKNFYPRPPRGGRRNTSYQRAMADIFLSTPSARRATPQLTVTTERTAFLSTPSARRATDEQTHVYQVLYDFYPRPPRGGRPSTSVGCVTFWFHFYPRPPRGGRPVLKLLFTSSDIISIHALREEGD